MSSRKHGFSLLSLLVLVASLGVMAFATSVQAAVPVFLIAGVPAAEGLDATATGEQEGTGTLLIPALNTEIKCTEVTVTGGLIKNSGEGKATSLLYKNCKTFHSSVEDTNCHVSDVHSGNASVLHVTALHPLLKPIEFTSGDFGVLASGFEVFINFLSGMGCTLPLKNSVTGSVCGLISAATNETVVPLVSFSKTIQESAGCGDKLLFGAQTAFIDGSAELSLTGHTIGKALGVLLF
jgi:hypothetical protein